MSLALIPEVVSTGSSEGEDEWIAWTWSDGHQDLLPGPGFGEDVPGTEIASLGTYTDGLGVGGQVSRLHRLRPDLWLAETGDLQERGRIDAFRGSRAAVAAIWLSDATTELGHFADLAGFAACRLHGLLPDEDIDSAVLSDVLVSARALAKGQPDPGLASWSGVIMFLSSEPWLLTSARVRRSLLAAAGWVEEALRDASMRAVLEGRLEAWRAMGD